MNTKIGVYILTHNRPQCILECVESVLNQKFKDFDLIISDNSDNNETKKLIDPLINQQSRLYYRHHNDLPTSYEHFYHIINSNEYEYYMLFHDDDQMMSDMVGTLYRTLAEKREVAAAATNAYLRINMNHTTKKYSPASQVSYLNTDGVIKAYSDGHSAPFPSFMYRKSMVAGIIPSLENGGKYCDVSYIVDIASKGDICILPDVLMYYNISPLQDSMSFDYLAHVHLTNHLLKISSNRDIVRGLRLFHVYHQAISNYTVGKMIFKHSVLRLLVKYSSTNYFPKYLIRLLQSKFYV